MITESGCLQRKYETIEKEADKFDFYEPPKGFVDFVNKLFRGKSADVKRYPGPHVPYIERIKG